MARKEEQRKKEKEEFGYGQTGPLTKQQQEACVSASATVGAFLRYICRREQKKEYEQKYRTIRFGYGQDPNNLTEAQQQAYVSASSTVDACS